MGLAIVVGMLADLAENDPEGVEHYREQFAYLNALLADNGLPAHVEPETLPKLENRSSAHGFPYSFLHYLRRAYAHRVADPSWIAKPFGKDSNPSDDPVLEDELSSMRSHLLCHSDAEGFYLPIDFMKVLFDDTDRIHGCMVGSSYRLLNELVYVAATLGIQLSRNELPDQEAKAISDEKQTQDGIWIERFVWLSMFEAARLSIKHRAAICFA